MQDVKVESDRAVIDVIEVVIDPPAASLHLCRWRRGVGQVASEAYAVYHFRYPKAS